MVKKAFLGTLLLLIGISLVAGGLTGLGRPAAAGGIGPDPAELSRRVIRLHVVANSDSDADQELKRLVRDAILAEVTPLFAELITPEQAREAVRNAIPRLEQVAADVVAAQGYSYPVNAELGEFDFPGKAYGDTFLPAGEYTALKLKIGEAAGANWWCVLFPPMCFEDWTRGVVREPKPGTNGTVTVNTAARRAPALVDESRTEKVPVRARVAAWEWAKTRLKGRQAR